MSILNLTALQLRKAAELQDQITTLESELASILGNETQPAQPAATAAPKKRGMSAAGKARIIAAQKARWAKVKAAKAAAPAAKTGSKPAKKFTMSAAAKAKISAAAKARWAKIKAKK